MANENDWLAFPQHANTGNLEEWRHGMTLRDYFAAKAMHALLTDEYTNREGIEPDRQPLYDVNDPEQSGTVAYLAYQMADAMLKARGAK